MLACPTCGADSDVIETRNASPQLARRRRMCRSTSCGHKFTTYEIIVSGPANGKLREAVVVSRRTLDQLLAIAQSLGGK